MGCLESVDKNSPAYRAEQRENLVNLGGYSCDDFMASFFLKRNQDGMMSQTQFDAGWASLQTRGMNLTISLQEETEEEKAAQADAMAAFMHTF